MKFRDMELDFDVYDADQAEAYEEALTRVREESAREVPDESLSAGVRRQCGVVFDFFDDLFGDGFHREVFGGKTNLRTCLEAFKEFSDLVDSQRRDMEALAQQCSPNRAARRGAAAAARRAVPADKR